jgi:hypothetical protein
VAPGRFVAGAANASFRSLKGSAALKTMDMPEPIGCTPLIAPDEGSFTQMNLRAQPGGRMAVSKA